jgi:hypothetical protein
VAINFITNDPDADVLNTPEQQAARPDRPASRAGFKFTGAVPQKVYDPNTAPDEFLFWQCREAALAAVETWESFDAPVSQWARSPNRKKLELSLKFHDPQITGNQQLNAFYDGDGLRFFAFTNANNVTTYSGKSTDTVSHETGHALLDSVRPELFESNLPEVNAFHEAFADCMALLTALSNQDTRRKLLADAQDLGSSNFVESMSEYLSDAVLKEFGNVAPSKPRRLLNDFTWDLPTSLPPGDFNDPPELLSAEAHSFSRVFSGCFYDVVRNIFTAQSAQTEVTLLRSTQTAAKLLVAGVRAAPETARYFQAVGRGMSLADNDTNGGANRDAIRTAFARHNIMLGSAAMLAPTAGLAGNALKFGKGAFKLSPATTKDIRERIHAEPGSKMMVNRRSMFGTNIAEAIHRREVKLGALDNRLKGVVAYAAERILVGNSGPKPAVLGMLPERNRTEDEVNQYVRTLLNHGRIAMDGKKPKGAIAGKSRKTPFIPTHVIRNRGGKKVLERVRFVCGH